jgi:uncharacterized Zn-finger protein
MPTNPPEVIKVEADADEVCCDGGNSALGHPAVWYSLDGVDMVECGYCDRQFVKVPENSSKKKKKAK